MFEVIKDFKLSGKLYKAESKIKLKDEAVIKALLDNGYIAEIA